MRIIRDVEWMFVGFDEYNQYLKSPAFNFQHRKYDDEVIALKVAKLVNVSKGFTFILDATKRMISASHTDDLLDTDPLLFDFFTSIK